MIVNRPMRVSDRQVALIRFVLRYREKYGAPPSQAEIGKGLGIASGTVRGHIRRLVALGLMTRRRGVSRGAIETPDGAALVGGPDVRA